MHTQGDMCRSSTPSTPRTAPGPPREGVHATLNFQEESPAAGLPCCASGPGPRRPGAAALRPGLPPVGAAAGAGWAWARPSALL